MKRILVITPIYKIIGRNELFRDTECVHDLIKRWKDENDIMVIFPYIRGLSRLIHFFSPKQLKYYLKGYRYDCDGIPVILLERQNLLRKQFDGFNKEKIRFKKIIKAELERQNFSPDVVIVHIPSASKFFMEDDLYNCGKIAVLHYSDVIYLKNRGKEFISFLETNFNKIYCRSKAIYNEFVKYNLNNLEKEIIYSGVPRGSCDTDIINSKFSNDKTQILYVGKLIKRKNLDILIKALSKIDNNVWNLNIIGTGKMLKKYQKLTKKLSLTENVHFLGKYPKDDVFNFMEKADIFCMPSIKETLGLVYLEAMSKGCITIGTKKEGIDGIIKNGENGFLTDPNVDKIFNLINNIIKEDNNKRRRIAENAVKTADFFNEEDMSKRYYDLISEVNHEK